MKKLAVLLMILLCLNVYAQEERPIGINLSSISPWSTDWIFKDVKKQSSTWIAEDIPGNTMDFSVPVPLTANGYPAYAPFDYNGTAYRPICFMLATQPEPYLYPAGTYTLIFEGTGEVEVGWDADFNTFTTPNTPHSVNISQPEWGIQVAINYSDSTDPVRNIRVILPGFEDSYEADPFHPRFIEVIRPFSVLRFMKPLAVEHTMIVSWNDRTSVDHHTYYSEDEMGVIRVGLPYEHLIRLCNEQEKDPWICVPVAADDNYVTQMARLFRDSLDPGRTIYLEYANETWNPDYMLMLQYVNQQGLDLGLSSDTTNAGLRYHTFRSLEIFDIFQNEFGSEADRINEVIATVPVGELGEVVVNALGDPVINPDIIMPDALAIAPYMGGDVIDHMVDQGLQCVLTPDDLLDSLEQNLQGWMDQMVLPFIHWTDSLGIELYAYEGGQYLTINEQPNDSCSTYLIAEANRFERMGSIMIIGMTHMAETSLLPLA